MGKTTLIGAAHVGQGKFHQGRGNLCNIPSEGQFPIDGIFLAVGITQSKVIASYRSYMLSKSVQE